MKKIFLICLMAVVLSIGVSATYMASYPLSQGWNSFGLWNNSCKETGDITINLANSSSGAYNLLGYSSDIDCDVDDIIFRKEDGSELTYQDAKDNSWISAMNYTNASLNQAGIGEPTTLSKYQSYWIKSYLAVNMTYPNVGGCKEPYNYGYEWKELRFFNGTDELNVTDADDAGWIFNEVNKYILYRDPATGWETVCGSAGRGGLCDNTTLFPWQGYFIYSNYDNITLIFNNQTIPPPTEYQYYARVNKNGNTIKEYQFDVKPRKVNWLIRTLEIIARVLGK